MVQQVQLEQQVLKLELELKLELLELVMAKEVNFKALELLKLI
jgi:hypothetical protein